jgi:DNA-binding NarL/FixJ family response regulator
MATARTESQDQPLPQSPIRIALVLRNRAFREGLHALLRERGHSVVGEFRQGPRALFGIRAARPDIAIFHETCGTRAERMVMAFRSQLPTTGFILLGMRSEQNHSLRRSVGSSAVIAEAPICLEDLDAAIDRAKHAASVPMPRRQLAPRALGLDLTAREADIVVQIALGFANQEIALQMGISPLTVKTHVHHALARLSLQTRSQLAAYARDQGWVDDSAYLQMAPRRTAGPRRRRALEGICMAELAADAPGASSQCHGAIAPDCREAARPRRSGPTVELGL